MSRPLKMEFLLWAFLFSDSPDHKLLSGSGWGKADGNVRSDSLSGGVCSPGLSGWILTSWWNWDELRVSADIRVAHPIGKGGCGLRLGLDQDC